MSDQIKHECGIALIRLRKPLEFYREKYGTALYGINKLSLLLQKQRKLFVHFPNFGGTGNA